MSAKGSRSLASMPALEAYKRLRRPPSRLKPDSILQVTLHFLQPGNFGPRLGATLSHELWHTRFPNSADYPL
eukprot:12922384-Prorocentrum_lima.AAC.1